MKLYESGATLAVNMGVTVSKMQDSIEAHIQASLKTVVPLERSFWQDGFRKEVLLQRHFWSRFRSTALHVRRVDHFMWYEARPRCPYRWIRDRIWHRPLEGEEFVMASTVAQQTVPIGFERPVMC